MSTFWNVLIVILLVLVIALALLYYFGQKAQKKQAATGTARSDSSGRLYAYY